MTILGRNRVLVCLHAGHGGAATASGLFLA